MSTTQLYPLSSQDGKAIPIEVARPKGLIMRTLVAGAVDSFVLPANFTLCWIFSSTDCIVKDGGTALPTSLVEGTEYADASFIPANTPTLLKLTPGNTLTVLPATANGTFYLNAIEQWATLLQNIQFNQG